MFESLSLAQELRSLSQFFIFESRIGTKNILKSYDTLSESKVCIGSEGANWQREKIDKKGRPLDSEGAVSEYELVLDRQ